jgi:arylformamidase
MIDISWPLSQDTTTYKETDDRRVHLHAFREWSDETPARESGLRMGLHSGTHIDAPSHFIKDGVTIDHIPLDQLSGKCVVLDLTSIEHEGISEVDLERAFMQAHIGNRKTDRDKSEESRQSGSTSSSGQAETDREGKGEEDVIVLFKTRNSELSPTAPFTPTFVYLTAAGAKFLTERQDIKAVGIDYLSIENSRYQPDHATHNTLLGNKPRSIAIIEGLRLAHVSPGVYQLICLPLALVGTEGAPARAVLLRFGQKG